MGFNVQEVTDIISIVWYDRNSTERIQSTPTPNPHPISKKAVTMYQYRKNYRNCLTNAPVRTADSYSVLSPQEILLIVRGNKYLETFK